MALLLAGLDSRQLKMIKQFGCLALSHERNWQFKDWNDVPNGVGKCDSMIPLFMSNKFLSRKVLPTLVTILVSVICRAQWLHTCAVRQLPADSRMIMKETSLTINYDHYIRMAGCTRTTI